MNNLLLLHTHSIMAFILATTQIGMFVYLYQLPHRTTIRRWMMANYAASIVWQLDQTVRFSLNPSVEGTLAYKLETVFVYSPALAMLMLTYFQILYLFLNQPFEAERRIMVRIVIPAAIALVGVNAWNEFANNSNLFVFQATSFIYGLLTNIWALVICLRKARLLQHTDRQAAEAHRALVVVNAGFIFMCVVVGASGLYSPVGYWTFFLFIWLCNLAQIVVYITYSAAPASFQIKIAGFSFVTVVTFLTVVTLVFFPPLLPTDLPARLLQQTGLSQMFVIIAGATAFVAVVLPTLLRRSLTQPVQRLLAGVQRVNGGDLTTQVSVGSPDEIGDLTRYFNQMTQSLQRAQDQLRDYADTLENKVEERTAALNQSLENLRAAQAQLVQAEKMASLGELTAGIAHEIQNPLNFVNNFSELSVEMIGELTDELRADHKDDALAVANILVQNLDKITQHGNRASAIVRSMLEHSRASSSTEQHPTNLNALAGEYLKTAYLGQQTKQAGFVCSLSTQFDPTLPPVKLGLQDIGRVLMNLFNNAFYTVQERGRNATSDYIPTVELITKYVDNKAVIIVKDNGMGMSATVLAKAFQPFFTTKPTGQGTGLGLSLSYDIVTKGHGGLLTAESQVGSGTAMTVQLPVAG